MSSLSAAICEYINYFAMRLADSPLVTRKRESPYRANVARRVR